MAYDNPLRISYSFGSVDFGAGDSTFAIDQPAGKRGVVADMHVSVTETFTDDTTSGFVRVGDGSDDDKFGELDMLTTAAGAALAGAGTGTVIETADTVEVNFVAPTGGTPAGIGLVTITVDWF